MASGELLNLLLYIAQQLGVILGVGSATVLLIAYLLAEHKDWRPEQGMFADAARKARGWGLFLMLSSGVGIVAVHVLAGQAAILFAPAFLLKWWLILLLLILHSIAGKQEKPGGFQKGFAGANWYALFVLHSVAPIVAWGPLAGLYVGWLAAFMVVWGAFLWIVRPHHGFALPKFSLPHFSFHLPKVHLPEMHLPHPAPAAPAPVVQAAPPPAPKPVAPPPPPPPKPVVVAAPPPPKPVMPHNLPVVTHEMLPTHKEELPVLSKPVSIPQTPQPVAPVQKKPEPEEEPDLPWLHIMPKKPEDVDNRFRKHGVHPVR